MAPVVLDAVAAERVGATAGDEWLLVTGVRWTEHGGTPIALSESYVPMEFKTDRRYVLERGGAVYSILEQTSGRTIDEVWQEIRAVEMPRGSRMRSVSQRAAHRFNCSAAMSLAAAS